MFVIVHSIWLSGVYAGHLTFGFLFKCFPVFPQSWMGCSILPRNRLCSIIISGVWLEFRGLSHSFGILFHHHFLVLALVPVLVSLLLSFCFSQEKVSVASRFPGSFWFRLWFWGWSPYFSLLSFLMKRIVGARGSQKIAGGIADHLPGKMDVAVWGLLCWCNSHSFNLSESVVCRQVHCAYPFEGQATVAECPLDNLDPAGLRWRPPDSRKKFSDSKLFGKSRTQLLGAFNHPIYYRIFYSYSILHLNLFILNLYISTEGFFHAEVSRNVENELKSRTAPNTVQTLTFQWFHPDTTRQDWVGAPKLT